ncbi:MAG TPA: carboxypeptidase-like regulatory domain-containing protein, partial [Pyrinomonadaceae bacterium]
MRFLNRNTSILALAMVVWLFQSAVSGQSKAGNLSPGGTVSGTVTIKGRPAGGIIVGLRQSEPSSPAAQMLRSKTDQDGAYKVMDVPPGTYEVSVTVPAYVVSEAAQGTTVVITAGESVRGIDLTLVRGGVITGSVTDADGKPVVEERVMLTKADAPANRRQFYPLSMTGTDDRGIYRMFGVPAGRYKVFVGRSDEGFFGGMDNRTVYKQTYHPDVADFAKATVVEVTDGSEVSDINIVVGRATPTFAIRGRVLDGETGNPVPKVQLGIQIIGVRRGYLGNNWSNAQGEFRIEGIAPGKYGVIMAAPPETNLRADTVNVEIVDQDIVGLVIRTEKAATVVGTVVLEDPNNKVARAKLAHLELQFYVRPTEQSTNFRMSRNSPINPDGTFR